MPSNRKGKAAKRLRSSNDKSNEHNFDENRDEQNRNKRSRSRSFCSDDDAVSRTTVSKTKTKRGAKAHYDSPKNNERKVMVKSKVVVARNNNAIPLTNDSSKELDVRPGTSSQMNDGEQEIENLDNFVQARQYENDIDIDVSGDEFNTDEELDYNSVEQDSDFENFADDKDSEVQFKSPGKGRTGTDGAEQEKEWDADLKMQRYIEQQIDKRWEQKLEQMKSQIQPQPGNRGMEISMNNESDVVKSKKHDSDPNETNQTSKNDVSNRVPLRVKSPSDTTLYAPGLTKTPDRNKYCMINKISDFVESIRNGGSVNSRGDEERERRRSNNEETRPGTSREDDQTMKAKELANKLILEAERFKASLNPPKGTSHQSYPGIAQNFNDLAIEENTRGIFKGVEPVSRVISVT